MYLVTGGAGFIGSNVVGALAARGDAVVVCDWMRSDDRWRNLARHEIVDLITPENLKRWLCENSTPIDAVIHMGAISATTETDVDLIAERNIRSTLDLCTWCTVNNTPFIYASSAATYGDGAQGFDDESTPDALARLRPLNAYGWSKHVVDRRIARMSLSGTNLPPQYAGLKFFNVYGPNEYHKGTMKSVIASNFSQINSGMPLRLFRSYKSEYIDGGQLRDFIYVRDCVDVIIWLLDHPAISGIFNVGTGKARSWLDLSLAMFKSISAEPTIEFVDMPAGLAEKYQYFTQANVSKLRAAGYSRSFTELEVGIQDYISGYLNNCDPYF